MNIQTRTEVVKSTKTVEYVELSLEEIEQVLRNHVSTQLNRPVSAPHFDISISAIYDDIDGRSVVGHSTHLKKATLNLG